MRTVVIANPNAGQRRREEFDALMEELAPIANRCEITGAAGDAEQMARELTRSKTADVIVAVGGDGTLNEIANGILSAGVAGREHRPAVCLVPTGTINILANELGLAPLSTAEHIAILERHILRPIDVGMAQNRAFLLMAGFGYDAALVQRVDLPLKQLVGQHAYLLSALTTLPSYKPSSITLKIDDDTVTSDAYMVLIANVSYYATSNMKVAPFAAVDDGWLDVCLFEKAPVAKIRFVTQFFMMLAHRHLEDPRVRYFRGKKVSVSASPAVYAQLDGDLWGETPMTIELQPKAINFLVPA